MHDRGTSLAVLAAGALVLVSSAHLLAGRLLRYATVSFTDDAARAALLFLAVAAAAFVHEWLIRGRLYAALRARVPAGLGAPLVAFAGAFAPAAARLALVARPRVPFLLLAAHAFMVELLLGFGLAWLALAAGVPRYGAAALSLVFAVRLFLVPVYHGGVLPLLELVAALAASLAVAGILVRPLAPHRAAVLEAA